ncbi:histidine--tRNA ligase [Candidatus Omnitrophota bacterium]
MLKALRGTKDILPTDVGIWQRIECSARNVFARYGYTEIRTPVIEEAALFIRSIGNSTDIVQKEMYVFSDRGGRQIALRPEATASIARSYVENFLGEKAPLTKLFYIGPMFRSERPQKGRQRQFHQLGIEAIGSDNPFLDVEVILLAVKFLEDLDIKDFNLKINSLGCQKDKFELIQKNKKALRPHLKLLCNECKKRYHKNVLRVFDCKNADCREVVRNIRPENSLCIDCAGHFETVKRGLEKIGVNYAVDLNIVRGLDYYTKTVFEITQEDLGSKDAISAGGRYNNLIQEMGGKYTPAIGFAFGIERLILAVKEDPSKLKPTLDIFMATTSDELYEDAILSMNSLRENGFSCDIDYGKRPLKAQMRMAEKLQVRFAIIFGEEEFRQDKVVVKDMKNRVQKKVKLKDLVKEIREARQGG